MSPLLRSLPRRRKLQAATRARTQIRTRVHPRARLRARRTIPTLQTTPVQVEAEPPEVAEGSAAGVDPERTHRTGLRGGRISKAARSRKLISRAMALAAHPMRRCKLLVAATNSAPMRVLPLPGQRAIQLT